MDNERHEQVSAISEIPGSDMGTTGYHFFASLGWSCLIGTAAMMGSIRLALAPSISAFDLIAGLFFLAIPVALFSLVGMVAIGLPVTALYRAAGAENRYLYAGTGAIAGFGVLALVFQTLPLHEPEALAIVAPGAFAGFSAALRWGRWREALARYRQELADGEALPHKRSNPIHDLIH